MVDISKEEQQQAFVELLNEKLPNFIKDNVAELRKSIDFSAIQPGQGILYSGDLLDRSEDVSNTAQVKNSNYVANLALNEGRITAGRADANSPGGIPNDPTDNAFEKYRINISNVPQDITREAASQLSELSLTDEQRTLVEAAINVKQNFGSQIGNSIEQPIGNNIIAASNYVPNRNHPNNNDDKIKIR